MKSLYPAMRKNLPEECLVKLHKCTKECGNKCCTQEECRTVLSFSISKLTFKCERLWVKLIPNVSYSR